MAHTVVDDIHELQFFALATGGRVILADRHGLGFLLPVFRLEHRERKLYADLIVALLQFLELLLCDVQFLPSIEVDGVDEEVGVDVLAVYMGADQHLTAVKVLRQPPRGFVGLSGIDRRALRKALHHVVKHYAALFVMQQLRTQKLIERGFRLTADSADELLPLPKRLAEL